MTDAARLEPFPVSSAREAAAAWHLRFIERPDLRETLDEAFRRWLDADPRHPAAYAEVEAAWALAREACESPEVAALREQALARLPSRVRRHWIAAAAAMVAVIGTSGWLATRTAPPQPRSTDPQFTEQVYRSALGQ